MGKKHTKNKRKTPPEFQEETVNALPWLRTAMLYGLIAFVFFLPWLPMSPVINNQTRQFFWLVNFSYFFSLVAAIGYYTGALQFPRSKYFVPIGIFLGIKALSSITSIMPFRSIWGGYDIWSDGLIYLIAIALICMSLSSLELTFKEIKNIIYAVVLQGFVMALLTLHEGWKLGLVRNIVRPDSPLQNSDYFLSFGFLMLPLLLLMWIRSILDKQGWRTWMPLTIGLATLGSALFICMPVGVQAIAFKSPASSTDTPINNAAADFLTNSSNTERWAEWDVGLRIGNNYPLLGSGPGTTSLAFLDLQREGYRFPGDEKGMTVHHPHNDLIEQYSQTGILGLLAYIGIGVSLTYAYLRKRRLLENDQRLIADGLFGGLALFMAFNIFLFTTVYTGVIAGLWAAILINMLGGITYQHIGKASILRKAITGTLLTALTVGMVSTWKYQSAERSSNKASASHMANQIRASISYSLEAVEMYPQEAYYNWQAGYYSLYGYAYPNNMISSEDLHILAQQAVYFSRTATAMNPRVPQYLLDQGIAEYFLSEPGSADEKLGIEHISVAESRSPMLYTMYLRAANFFALKGDLERASQQLQVAYKNAPEEKKSSVQNAMKELETKQAPK